ncbi:MAG: peptidoglycan DD-metalloendopeptidase family protein [Oscillospiraceae bacterium]|jgi:murein DD-endopeptidase MepM/ murein hydrolase activator NlpD|nr:peptidoglycan DD-metalloendopeptidase family protein [Oscillospiraceae bacterium]
MAKKKGGAQPTQKTAESPSASQPLSDSTLTEDLVLDLLLSENVTDVNWDVLFACGDEGSALPAPVAVLTPPAPAPPPEPVRSKPPVKVKAEPLVTKPPPTGPKPLVTAEPSPKPARASQPAPESVRPAQFEPIPPATSQTGPVGPIRPEDIVPLVPVNPMPPPANPASEKSAALSKAEKPVKPEKKKPAKAEKIPPKAAKADASAPIEQKFAPAEKGPPNPAKTPQQMVAAPSGTPSVPPPKAPSKKDRPAPTLMQPSPKQPAPSLFDRLTDPDGFWSDAEPLYQFPLGAAMTACFRLVYFYGLSVARWTLIAYRRARPVLLYPLRYLWSLLRIAVLAADRLTLSPVRKAFWEAGTAHSARLERISRRRQLTAKDWLAAFFQDYRSILRTTCNALLPLAALAVLLVVIQSTVRTTYALKVVYNDESLGYIANESVFEQAQAMARKHIILPDETASETEVTAAPPKAAADSEPTTVVTSPLSAPRYVLERVSPEQLMDSTTLCDQLLGSASLHLTSACGVYVDGTLVATIKNETEARAVLDSVLATYSGRRNPGDTVGFMEDIRLEQGYFPETSEENGGIMTDANQLLAKLTGTKKGAKYEYAREEDSIYSIAKRFGTTEEHLLVLNPQFRDAYLHPNEAVLISEQVQFLQVKVISTETITEKVPYEIIKTDNYDLFQGEYRIRAQGAEGEDSVTRRVTLVNNQRVSVEEVSRTRIKEPTPERRDIGRKSTRVSYNGQTYNLNPSATGFVWPTPSLHTITSPYGYRSGGFHSGVDISGSGASGKTIVAAKAGRVEMINHSSSGYGNQIVIDHGNGVKTRYAHIYSGSISVSVGERVETGQPIARVGNTGNSTGPHLHFEVIINGNTQNPLPYIR